MLSDQGYDGKKADVWSCGVILYVLLAGFLPFDESTIVALFAKIQSAEFTYPSWFGPETRSLLDQMLVADPKARITVAQLKQHAWFARAGVDASGSPEAPLPTEAQLAAAVQPVGLAHPFDRPDGTGHGHSTGFGLGHAAEGKAANEDDEDGDSPKGAPVALNAFDVVSQCGGFMLDKTFSPEIFYTAPDEAAAALPKSQRILSGRIRTKCNHFTASNISPRELSAAIYDALQAMGFDFDQSRDAILNTGCFKTPTLLSAKGMLGMAVQVFTLTPSLSLLEIRKGKGDILEWSSAYSELVDRRIAHLINRPKHPDGDVKEYY